MTPEAEAVLKPVLFRCAHCGKKLSLDTPNITWCQCYKGGAFVHEESVWCSMACLCADHPA